MRSLAASTVACLVLLTGCQGEGGDEALGPAATSEASASPSVTTASAVPSATVTPTARPTPTTRAPTPRPRRPSPSRTPKPVPPPEPSPERSPSRSPEPDPESDFTVYGRTELIAELNKRRAGLGLKPVSFRESTADQAEECSTENLREGTFEHCGYEALFAGTGRRRWPVKTMLDTWFGSPSHRRMLVDPKVRFAGGAAVSDGDRTVAAITLAFE